MRSLVAIILWGATVAAAWAQSPLAAEVRARASGYHEDPGRRELPAVLDEKAPSNVADWTLKDSRDARVLLDSLAGRS